MKGFLGQLFKLPNLGVDPGIDCETSKQGVSLVE
jgi:hypothetical protein